MTSREGKEKDLKSESRLGRPKFQASSLRSGPMLTEILHKVSHEIGNPLTSIISLGAIMSQSQFAPTLGPAKMQSYTESIIEEAWRIAVSNERLVHILSDRRLQPYPCDLLEILRQVRSRLRKPAATALAQLEVRCDLPSPTVFGEDSHLKILLRELLINASEFFDATSSDGILELQITEMPSSKSQGSSKNIRTIVTLTNTTASRCEHDLSLLFEPFITSHKEIQRLGLGLTVAAVIVEHLGGTLEVEEIPVQGKFLFRVKLGLPTATDETAKKKTTSVGLTKNLVATSAAVSGEIFNEEEFTSLKKILPTKLRLLIVEDEPTITSSLKKTLEVLLQAHTTLEIELAKDQAVTKCFTSGKYFDIIICDVRLSGITGEEVYHQAIRSNQKLEQSFIFITGDGKEQELQEFLHKTSRPCLEKPFTLTQLIQALTDVLAKR